MRCLAGEFDEGRLGDFLGKLRRTDLAQRGGIDEAEMALDDFGESVLGVVPGVTREQFQVSVAHIQKDNVAARGKRTKISCYAWERPAEVTPAQKTGLR